MEGEVEERYKQCVARVRQRIHALFRELAQHKRELAEGVQAARKEACRPLADAVLACRVLGRVRDLEERGDGGGKGASQDAFEEEDEEWEARAGAASQPLPPLITARAYHGAAVVTSSNHVFVMGGIGSRYAALNSVERLGIANGSAWETGLTIPTARYRCGACAVGNPVVVVGGEDCNGTFSDIVEAVNTVTGVRASLPPLPRRVAGCRVVNVQGKVIVTGGFDGTTSYGDAWVLDLGNNANLQRRRRPLQWVSLPSMAQARYYHGAAAGGGCVFVCGGEYRGSPIGSCEMLRLAMGGDGEAQGGWEALPPMPMELLEIGCCYGGGNVFVAGGFHGDQRSVFALNVRKRWWTLVSVLATGRRGCTAVCVGRRVMVLGGFNIDGFLDSCEMFEF